MTHPNILPRLIYGCVAVALGSVIMPGAQAVDTNATTNGADVVLSAYDNSNNRPDPFLPVKLKNVATNPRGTVGLDADLKLQGILADPAKPVAIINRQPVALNETVTLRLPSGEMMVKAIRIERDRVVLRAGDREIELQIPR